MILSSACQLWQPDRRLSAAQQRRCYTTRWDTTPRGGDQRGRSLACLPVRPAQPAAGAARYPPPRARPPGCPLLALGQLGHHLATAPRRDHSRPPSGRPWLRGVSGSAFGPPIGRPGSDPKHHPALAGRSASMSGPNATRRRYACLRAQGQAVGMDRKVHVMSRMRLPPPPHGGMFARKVLPSIRTVMTECCGRERCKCSVAPRPRTRRIAASQNGGRCVASTRACGRSHEDVNTGYHGMSQ